MEAIAQTTLKHALNRILLHVVTYGAHHRGDVGQVLKSTPSPRHVISTQDSCIKVSRPDARPNRPLRRTCLRQATWQSRLMPKAIS
jgi:hypothetical protein